MEEFILLFDHVFSGQLTEMRRLTSQKLIKRGERPTSGVDKLIFFVIIILVTRFEFGNRRDLLENCFRV